MPNLSKKQHWMTGHERKSLFVEAQFMDTGRDLDEGEEHCAEYMSIKKRLRR